MAVVVVSLVVALGYAGLVLGVQRSVMYPAPAPPITAPVLDGRGVETLRLGPAGDREAWLMAPGTNRDRPLPVVLFAHANAEIIDDWVGRLEPLRDAGYAVLLVEYPGYGRTPGKPSETSLTQAVLDGFDALAGRPDIDPDRIFAWGRSLGGGPACALAARRPVAGLILESSFSSARSLALRAGVLPFLVLDPWDNLAQLEEYRGPLLVVHGERDTIIPPDHGRLLFDAVPGAEWVGLPCGHNDCARPWAAILEFLDRHAAPAPGMPDSA